MTWGVFLWLAASGCQPAAKTASSTGQSGGDGAPPLVRVTPIHPARKTLIRRTEQPGEIEAFEETPLYAKVAGYVEAVHVDIGDRVRGPKRDPQGHVVVPGQVLADLSIPELDEEYHEKQAIVEQSQAEVQQAIAAVRVAEAAHASARARLEEIEAAVDRTQADYERYRSEFVRLQELADKGAVTRQVVDEKQNQFRASNAARKETAAKILSAKAAVAELQAQLDKSQADREGIKAKLRVAQAGEQRVAALLKYTKIRAPYDGIVCVRNVHTEHFVQPGTGGGGKPIFVVMRIDKVRIFLDVPAADAVLVRIGGEAKIRVPSVSAATFPGAVTRTAWMMSKGTRTLRTEIDIENSDGQLRPGMYAYADLKVAERPEALVLPHAALWTAEDQTYCFLIDESGRVSRHPVSAGIRAGDEVEIVSGLSGEESLIGANPSAFRDGQRVEVVAPRAAPR